MEDSVPVDDHRVGLRDDDVDEHLLLVSGVLGIRVADSPPGKVEVTDNVQGVPGQVR